MPAWGVSHGSEKPDSGSKQDCIYYRPNLGPEAAMTPARCHQATSNWLTRWLQLYL